MNHKNIPFSIATLVSATVHKIEGHSDDLDFCINSVLVAGSIFRGGEPGHITDLLIGLLSNNDPKVVALSILYSGMLYDMGMDTTKAMGPIRNMLEEMDNLESYIVSAINAALVMFKDREAIEWVKEIGLYDLDDFKMRNIRTVIEQISKNRTYL